MEPVSNEPVIAARGVRFQYPDGVEALRGIDFDLAAGETVALLGANGSGKTTFLLQLVGLLRGAGEIRVCGEVLTPEAVRRARQKIGVLFQDSDDQLFMPTVAEDVACGRLNLGVDEREVDRRVADALARVGLTGLEERAPHHLSAGQKRRAALAGVLAMDPEIILLDEPATFLDPPSRDGLVETLRELHHAQVMVTHDVELARALATRAVFFERGLIVGEGTVDEMVERFGWSGR